MRYNAPVQRLSEATAIEQYPRLKREEHRNDPLQNGDRTMTHRDVLDVRLELQVPLLPPLLVKQMSGLGEGIVIPGPRIPPQSLPANF